MRFLCEDSPRLVARDGVRAHMDTTQGHRLLYGELPR
ncbi:hypothetical protein SAMN06272771_4549 [Streptomyces sp. Ag82_O1-12]|nr:hypothetical protein SAMN06272771_4549 [Streptomyces sp. Ag82_O1-12]SOD47147.1 hypothetical protein SAMN06272727_4549 [Streptomyces sp. Ag82_G6-1]